MERAEVRFFEERNPRIAAKEVCEVTVVGHGHVVRARAAASDTFAAVDSVVAKLEHRLEKLKGRLIGRSRPHRHSGGPPGPEAVTALAEDDSQAEGLYVVLGTEGGIEVVGEAEDGAEAVAKAEELAPDVVLMDVRMPQVNGIEAARTIRTVTPSARILMLTVSDEEEDLYEAVKAGAN